MSFLVNRAHTNRPLYHYFVIVDTGDRKEQVVGSDDLVRRLEHELKKVKEDYCVLKNTNDELATEIQRLQKKNDDMNYEIKVLGLDNDDKSNKIEQFQQARSQIDRQENTQTNDENCQHKKDNSNTSNDTLQLRQAKS